MRWHEGTIPVAITEAKQRNKIFVVFISGDDDHSLKMRASLDDPNIVGKIADESVALQLEANSDSVKQFSQIYPVVIVPSTFFIGTNGTPLEVIGGHLEPDQLRQKIERVLDLHRQQRVPLTHNLPSVDGSSISQSSEDSRPGPSTSQGSIESQEEKIQLDERIQRAKSLAESIREKKAREEEEQEKLREIERRKLGKDLLKHKQKQQELETKKVADEIAKDRMEEKAAREKVREQISRDRADRAEKYNKDVAERERQKQEELQAKLAAEQAKVAADAAKKSKFARLQFRLPDGSSSTQQFEAVATLNEVFNHIKENVKPPFPSFTMSVAFPKREFVQNDFSQTLKDLQLAPSACIYVLPTRRITTIQSSSSTGSFNFLWLLLGPFLSMWRMVSVFLFGNGGTPPARTPTSGAATGGSNSAGTPLTRPSMSRSPANRRGPNNESDTFQRREGNIYRLRDPGRDGEDDEDNNTWNGNSTQQM